jgi:hypothetical protein
LREEEVVVEERLLSRPQTRRRPRQADGERAEPKTEAASGAVTCSGTSRAAGADAIAHRQRQDRSLLSTKTLFVEIAAAAAAVGERTSTQSRRMRLGGIEQLVGAAAAACWFVAGNTGPELLFLGPELRLQIQTTHSHCGAVMVLAVMLLLLLTALRLQSLSQLLSQIMLLTLDRACT